MSTTSTATNFAIDLRSIVPHERHAIILSRFGTLRAGESLELVNDHDPKPLRYKFDSLLPGQYDWQYLEAGPVQWRVRIGKSSEEAMLAAEDSCCSGGACGG
jgi:uncharacterized protein (DUF2249 family)